MEKSKLIDLLQRSLGIKHKLKVHDSMPRPDNHEEMATNTIARWELEDELNAIEEILRTVRSQHVAEKKAHIEKKGVVKKKSKR